MNIILITISSILLIFDIYIFQKNRQLFNRKIKYHNVIRFSKLSKQFLNNTDNEDIKDLICFLYKYIKKEEMKKK